MLRRLGTVILLFALMLGLPLLGLPREERIDPESMAVFGFVVLAAFTLGELAETIRLPHITGYLLTGILCGPWALGIVRPSVVEHLRLFNDLAVALIGLSAGAALDMAFLRRRIRLLASVLGGQFAVLLPSIVLVLLALSGPVAGFALPGTAGLSWPARASAAALLAVVASSMSPAATFAVLDETRARGTVADTLLGVSVLNNVAVVVLFALASAMAAAVAPDLLPSGGTTGQAVLGVLSRRLGGAAAAGLVLGGALAIYVKVAGFELIAVIAGLGFAATFAARSLGIDPMAVFIAAGFTWRNLFPAEAGRLRQVTARLSLPVFVVFFFVAGAGLHLDALLSMGSFALLVFGARMAALYAGTRLGSRLAGGPVSLERYGWMGFTPQAGIALTLALVLGHVGGPLGSTLETLAVAGVAINELVGPVLLKVCLGLAGETREDPVAPPEPEPPEPAPEGDDEVGFRLPEWLPEPGRTRGDPWEGLPQVQDRRLVELSRSLRADLQTMVRDFRSGVVAGRRRTAISFLDSLGTAFLRAHRRTAVRAMAPSTGRAELLDELRRQRVQLARRWEDALLDRGAAADFRQEAATIEQLLRAIDQKVEALPAAIEVPMEDRHLRARTGERRLAGLRRAWLRALSRVTGRPPVRVLEPRALGRFALGGHVPRGLEDAAGLAAASERHLLARARNLFEVYRRSMDEAVANSRFAPGSFVELLDGVREELEEELDLARREVDRQADETVRACAAALGREWGRFNRLIEAAGTPDLPRRSWRLSRIYDERQESIARIRTGLAAATDITRGLASGLAMELELLRLRTRLREIAEEQGREIGRALQGRVIHQAGRAHRALATALQELAATLDGPRPDSGTLVEDLERATAPAARVLDEALAATEGFRNALKTQALMAPLHEALATDVDALTERFLLPAGPTELAGRGLPSRPELREVSFRELVQHALDADVLGELTGLFSELLAHVEAIHQGLEDLRRALDFNLELAATELSLLPEGTIPDTVREVVHDVLIGTLKRIDNRLEQLLDTHRDLGDATTRRVVETVTGQVEILESALTEGRWGELRARMARVHVRRRGWSLQGGPASLAGWFHAAGRGIQDLLGEKAARRIRLLAGLELRGEHDLPSPAAFAPPAPRVVIPPVYRRLFSDAALEAGDVLAGREHEIEHIRRVLAGANPGSCRSVAVVGLGSTGRSAVVNALLRGLGRSLPVERHALSAPLEGAAGLDELLSAAPPGSLVVIENLEWLFSIRPGGFEPLRSLLERIAADRGRRAWLVSADRPVWAYARRVLPLDDAFPERFASADLDVERLRRILLRRHAMSGYALRFVRVHPSLLHRLSARIARAGDGTQEVHDAWFARLHAECGGRLSDALRLWLASITAIDTERDEVVLGPVAHTPMPGLQALPDEVLMTLRQVFRQGRITAELHAGQFRTTPAESALLLGRLAHWGILAAHPDGSWRLSAELAGPLYRVLRHRGIVG